MTEFRPVFGLPRPLVGMVHVLPTPASPGYAGVDAGVERARSDAQVLVDAGFDALLVENFHDFPPLREGEMGPEVPAYLTRVATAVREVAPASMPVGIQVLFAAHRVAVAVAAAAGLQFVRVEAWTYGHLADKGWVEASAGRTVRYARAVQALDLQFWADLKKKHASHAVTADVSLEAMAAGLADHAASAVVVTGTSTGVAPEAGDLRRVRDACGLPVVLGSGLTVQNAPSLVPLVDAAIVGSAIKAGGEWRNPVDSERARALVRSVEKAR